MTALVTKHHFASVEVIAFRRFAVLAIRGLALSIQLQLMGRFDDAGEMARLAGRSAGYAKLWAAREWIKNKSLQSTT